MFNLSIRLLSLLLRALARYITHILPHQPHCVFRTSTEQLFFLFLFHLEQHLGYLYPMKTHPTPQFPLHNYLHPLGMKALALFGQEVSLRPIAVNQPFSRAT